MNKDTKMIRIVSRGYVSTSRGRIMSPVMSPYRESINRIWSMLTVDRADIDEKLPDGSFIRLNIQNYDRDNTIKEEVATNVPVKPVAPTPAPVVNTVPTQTKVEKPDENTSEPIEPEKAEEVKTLDETPSEKSLDKKSEEPVEVPSEPKDENGAEVPSEEIDPEDTTDESGEESDSEDSDDTTPENNNNQGSKNNKKNRKRNKNRQNSPITVVPPTGKVDGNSLAVSTEEA